MGLLGVVLEGGGVRIILPYGMWMRFFEWVDEGGMVLVENSPGEWELGYFTYFFTILSLMRLQA
jgi:hypothetical protein